MKTQLLSMCTFCALLTLLLQLCPTPFYGQCAVGESAIVLDVDPGGFGSEVSWVLLDDSGDTVSSRSCGSYSSTPSIDTLCLTDGADYTFQALDDWGDGWNGGTFQFSRATDDCEFLSGAPNNGVPGDHTTDCAASQTELSVVFQPDQDIIGCIHPAALNFNPCANLSDGSCLFYTTNDDCSDGLLMEVNTVGSCSLSTFGSTIGATYSDEEGSVFGGCVGTSFPDSVADVWFKVPTPASGNLLFTHLEIPGTTSVLEFYKGTCGSLSRVPGSPCSSYGVGDDVALTGLSTWDTIFVRYWDFGNDDFGTFELCVSEPVFGCTVECADNYNPLADIDDGSCSGFPSGGANDDCTSAPLVTEGSYEFYSVGATSDFGAGDLTDCTSDDTLDMWVAYTIPTGVDTIVVTTCGSNFDTGLSIWTGCFNDVTAQEIACNDDDIGSSGLGLCGTGSSNESSLLLKTAAYHNVTVYIRVAGYEGTSGCGFINIIEYPLIDPCSPPSLSGVVTDETCASANGAIDLTLTGGSGSFDISWSTGASTEDLTGLSAGSYTATVSQTSNPSCLDSLSFVVTEIIDLTPPALSCPSDVTIAASTGVCEAFYSYVVDLSDNCPGASYTQIQGLPSGSVFPIGITTNKFAAVDAAGNVDTCSFKLTVIDGELPTIGCPSDTVLSITSPDSTANFSYSVPFTDNCSGVMLEQLSGLASGSDFPLGITSNAFVATDVAMNTNSCSFTVEVVNNSAPVINCPPIIATNAIPTVCGATVSYNVTATDDQPGVSVAQISGQGSGALFPVGTTTNVWVATDAVGNTDTCFFDVIISDIETPVLNCPGDVTLYTAPGNCTATYTYFAFATDNCSGVMVQRIAGFSSGSPFPLGTTTTTYVATDASGNMDTCSFNVTVVDTISPVLSCPADITIGTDPGNCETAFTYTVSAIDDCDGVLTPILINGLASGSYFPLGNTLVTYEATDTAGNTVSCSFTVTVEDDEPALPTCLPDTTLITQAAQCSAVYNYTITDNCPGFTVTVLSGLASGSSFPLGATSTTIVVADAGGNSDTCTFVVTVLDTVLPIVSCPADTILPNDAGMCGAVYLYEVSSTDNCSGGSITQNSGLASGTLFPVGPTLNDFDIFDASGNMEACAFTVTVNYDDTAAVSAVISNSSSASPTGAIDLTLTGGVPSFSFSWSNGATSEDISGVAGGIYSVQITDGHGCMYERSFEVGVLTQCIPPVNLGSVALSDSKIRLTWDPVPEAIKYNICGRRLPGPGYQCKSIPAISVKTFSGLTTGRTYYWHISSVCVDTVTSITSDTATFLMVAPRFASLAEEIFLYPNPTDKSVSLTYVGAYVGEEEGELEILLIDMVGRVALREVYSLDALRASVQLAVSDYASGTYFLEFHSQGAVSAKQLIIQH